MKSVCLFVCAREPRIFTLVDILGFSCNLYMSLEYNIGASYRKWDQLHLYLVLKVHKLFTLHYSTWLKLFGVNFNGLTLFETQRNLSALHTCITTCFLWNVACGEIVIYLLRHTKYSGESIVYERY